MPLNKNAVSPPVLLLIFNRPTHLQKCIERVHQANPESLFIAADGPRKSHPEDRENCLRARNVVQHFNWNCEVHKLFQERNLGCQVAVSTAISWFFDHVDQGIIMEDDCVADPSFFPFCSSMLQRYISHEHVGVVTGNNYQHGRIRGTANYYFSKFNHCWGWATWKRAWQRYDHDMSESDQSDREVIANFSCAPGETEFWKRQFELVRKGKLNSWAIRWTRTAWRHRMLTVTPQVNLVENIGFGPEATHTKRNFLIQEQTTQTLWTETNHPERIWQDSVADSYCAREHFGIGLSLRERIIRTVQRAFKRQ